MIARIPETKKKPGVCYAPTDDGVELPVIDITHPAFALGLSGEELEKRRILGTEGFVSSFVVVDTETADVITGPKIYLNAVAEDESEFDKVRHQIVEQLQDAMMTGTRDTYKLQQIMRRTLGGWVARQLHRKPMIVPVVADIAQDVDDAMGLNAAK